MNLNGKATHLFHEQVTDWDLARENFDKLKNVQIRSFSFGGFEVKAQFNPARLLSTTTRANLLRPADRKCFLCKENLPEQQKGIDVDGFTILVNPYPIFPIHFTIPKKEHIPQQVKPFYKDMLFFAKELSDYIIFYNGPKCGASAPDHMHFQAGNKNFIPLYDDYQQLKDTNGDFYKENENAVVYKLNNYLRTVLCIEAETEQASIEAFNDIYTELQTDADEPMMNAVCIYENDKWYTFILPRKQFRPWQFSAEDEKDRLIISPGSVEMSGIFITPFEEDFKKITKGDIVDIYEQISRKI